MDEKDFFLNPEIAIHKQYEALRAFYIEGLSSDNASRKFKLSSSYFKKLRFQFSKSLKEKGNNPFFQTKKSGPKGRFTEKKVIDEIIALRKQNHSISDIRSTLEAKNKKISLDTIDKILKSEGFAPLPKRTHQERQSVSIPSKIEAPQSVALEIEGEEFSTEIGGGVLTFLPLLERLGVIQAIEKAEFPETSVLTDISSVLSFVALKILGNERHYYDTRWNLDRALGFFAGLNVLPKKSTLSSYSYRVKRSSNKKLLLELSKIFEEKEIEEGEFNLDFKTIPHWGDESVLEKNWSGSRHSVMKSILSLIVQNPNTGYISYTDADIKKGNQNDAILDFVDFWTEGRGIAPKMLIFDSKLTTYENLDKLNKSKEKIKFITLRRRGKELVKKVSEINESDWQKVKIEGEKRKYKVIKVHAGESKLRNYEGKVRQIILTDHGRDKPTFLITNDFSMDVKKVVKKYARRWLVEQEIAEQISFFHLNQLSSSIVVKVDFDLTISLLVHNLYRVLANHLSGFEKCTVSTINRKFLENGAFIKINGNEVIVYLKKKTHLPILLELPWLKEKIKLSWLGVYVRFEVATTT